MKIYQIHEFGGCWEDMFDRIVGTYLLEDKAIDVMNDLVNKATNGVNCRSCPLEFLSNGNNEEPKFYCSDYEPDEFNDCLNFYLEDACNYKVVAREVIE